MEFSMTRVNALIKKEIKDLSKNMNIVMMCAFPIIFCIIYLKLFEGNTSNVEIDKVQILLLCININFLLVSCFSIVAMIAEEKEKNTLRNLILSGVTPLEFLIGKMITILLVSVIIDIIMFFIVGIDIQYLWKYVILTTLVVVSMIEIGAILGIIAQNQLSANIIAMPVMMFFLFIATYAKFNESIEKIAVFLPNYNINIILDKIFKGSNISIEHAYGIFVILIWIVISGVAFAYVYKKRRLDN
ncbi:ABC transporter permease [Clostridium saccharobutylicum]|uniref:ABC-2 type transporter superfamily n=1 Tax=Clostridium saccharobutylicum DSM 13864 TaxID=1345695 RepID=U5MRH3_CLOSA|nr:ABC transporter permease [Clostridium saccharobutylicum]AGX42022.1 ABC-2 type transporter superfamily [Clostridium saccharobutylicum DSM 13864]AQR89301.1 ABC-2 family transporter protein [Clostridium saccharobutylicum]AQR99202.1 ABC-2 family transporter protein [Clostridium saccharobutylicum]AQS08939.1 ABC-2 family transporter protein [Clostridium saccharobutylicum]AQS13190.1 ABC-2 family transporter protein [Clostridium saccharobutylicum]